MAGGLTGPIRSRLRRVVPAVVVATALLAACGGGDDPPELTFEDRLVQLEGRPLTPAELAERAEVGATLCLLDDRVLDEMWQQLSDEQLDFQDIVIAELCPDRAILYAGHTGRFVTEEAEESGVRTSTTRPTSTTAAVSGPTSRPTTGAGPGSIPSPSPDPSSPTTASSTTVSSTTTTITTTSTSTTRRGTTTVIGGSATSTG